MGSLMVVFKEYQMMILSKRRVVRSLLIGAGSTLPFPCIRAEPSQTQVGTEELPSRPLAWSRCSLLIPNTK